MGRRLAQVRVVGHKGTRRDVGGIAPNPIAVELIRQWHWRYVAEGNVVPGWELCVVTPDSGLVVRLARWSSGAVSRDDLRHACCGRVTPFAPARAEAALNWEEFRAKQPLDRSGAGKTQA